MLHNDPDYSLLEGSCIHLCEDQSLFPYDPGVGRPNASAYLDVFREAIKAVVPIKITRRGFFAFICIVLVTMRLVAGRILPTLISYYLIQKLLLRFGFDFVDFRLYGLFGVR